MLGDVAWAVGVFAVLGVVAGLVWWKVVEPPTYQRTDTGSGAVMDQLQLAHRIRADGWYSVIGFVASLGAGFALMGWRRRDPLLVLVAGTLASVAAAYAALRIGTSLGHHDVAAEVRAASVGGRVPDSLMVISRSVLLVWPVGFLVAAMAILLGGAPEAADPPAATGVGEDEVAARQSG